MPKVQPPLPPSDFPMPFQDFANRLRGTEDEIWTTLLKVSFGAQNLTFGEWMKRLETLKG